MNRDDMEVIAKVCESLERKINDTMKGVVDNHDMLVTLNIMINIGTTILAKALIMVKDEDREQIEAIAFNAVGMKVEEGNAVVHSILAIQKAKHLQ